MNTITRAAAVVVALSAWRPAGAQADATAASYAMEFRRLAREEQHPDVRRYLIDAASFFDCVSVRAREGKVETCVVPVPPRGYDGPKADFTQDTKRLRAQQTGDFVDCSRSACIDTSLLRAPGGNVLGQTRAFENSRVTIRRGFSDPDPPPASGSGMSRGTDTSRAVAPSQLPMPPRVVPVSTGIEIQWVGRVPDGGRNGDHWLGSIRVINDNEFAVDISVEGKLQCPDGNLVTLTLVTQVRWFSDVTVRSHPAPPCSNGWPPSPDSRVALRYSATRQVRPH